MHSIWNDIRYALRQLRKSPGFATVAILTLAIGIGATTAIFTLVYDVLLKPLPYNNPSQLVVLREQVAEIKDVYPTLPMNASNFFNWQRHSRSFQAMTIMEQDPMPLGAGGHPLRINVLRATPGIFPVLDVTPQFGREFTEQEDAPGKERVVLLMHGLWARQFHSDPEILGKTVRLNGYPYVVIGVMPRDFHLPSGKTLVFGGGASTADAKPAQAIVPLALTRNQLQEVAGDFNYFGVGRLKPGVSAAQAQAELNGFQRAITASLPAEYKMTLSAWLAPFQQYLVGNSGKSLRLLLLAVAGLLLVGCINVMNLLLARAVGRRREMAIASALGASRADLVRVSMREAGVLAAIGGALGLLLAAVTVPILQHYLPAELNFRGSLHMDWAGAGFAVLIAIAATLLAGFAPAWMSLQTQPQEVLRAETRSASESHTSKRLRKALVAAEVSISVMLVLVTGWFTLSLLHLLRIDRGFDPTRVIAATVDLPDSGYSKETVSVAFYRQLVQKLDRLPGVEKSAVVSELPLGGDTWVDAIQIPGDTRSYAQMPVEHIRWISPGYLQTIHLPLIEGRLISPDDSGRRVAVISSLTAKTLWSGKDPIGRQFTRGGEKEPVTVIGVVGNARTLSLAKPDPMMIYVPYWYRSETTAGLVVRTKQDPSEMAAAIRKTIWSLDPTVAVPEIRTLGGVASDSVAAQRFEMDLLLLFAVSALLLASLGVYGVVTYSVEQRRQEIGLRMALGAQRANIYAQIVREGMVPVVGGAVVGILAAFAFARVIGSLLFHVSPFNPWIAAVAAASLLFAGVVACLLPARRAASVDPMQALRTE